MTNEEEYVSAVTNLASRIVEYSHRDLSQFDDDTEQMSAYIANNPEIKQDWDLLETHAEIIADRFCVEYNTLVTHVWLKMNELPICVQDFVRTPINSITKH